MRSWHTLDLADALRDLNTDDGNGLDEAAVARRQAEHGLNELAEHGLKSPWQIVWE